MNDPTLISTISSMKRQGFWYNLYKLTAPMDYSSSFLLEFINMTLLICYVLFRNLSNFAQFHAMELRNFARNYEIHDISYNLAKNIDD